MERNLNVTLNGKPQELPASASVAVMVVHLELSNKRIAVEVNKELVTKNKWQSTVLKEGDRIEIVTFVGGG